MAKRAKRRPLRASKGNAKSSPSDQQSSRQYSASTLLHPSSTSCKRRVATACAKHTLPIPTTVKPTLAERFYSLPTELRAEIFALLLVRPVKWQFPHLYTPESCPRLLSNDDLTPELRVCQMYGGRHTCVRCVTGHHFNQRSPLWLSRQDPGYSTWMNPWRSMWAPEVRNEFVCSDCWDEEFRPRPHPQQKVCVPRAVAFLLIPDNGATTTRTADS